MTTRRNASIAASVVAGVFVAFAAVAGCAAGSPTTAIAAKGDRIGGVESRRFVTVAETGAGSTTLIRVAGAATTY